MKNNYLIEENNQIKFNGDIMKIYIPKSYFEKELAEYNGNFINTIGIFLFEVNSFERNEKGLDGEIHTLKLPVRITFEYDDKNNEKRTFKNLEELQYEVFTLNKGNVFMTNKAVEKNITNVKDFIYMLHKGNLPAIIPYDEIIQLYLGTLDINGINLGCPSLLYELTISELLRSNQDIKIPFRKAINRESVGPYDYKNINMKNIPLLSSTYSSLAFEDINQSIVTSIKRNINNEKELESPIEKTIKY